MKDFFKNNWKDFLLLFILGIMFGILLYVLVNVNNLSDYFLWIYYIFFFLGGLYFIWSYEKEYNKISLYNKEQLDIYFKRGYDFYSRFLKYMIILFISFLLILYGITDSISFLGNEINFDFKDYNFGTIIYIIFVLFVYEYLLLRQFNYKVTDLMIKKLNNKNKVVKKCYIIKR